MLVFVLKTFPAIAGDWASCFEWCLSKPNHCVQLWAEVRRNGSEVEFTGCQQVVDTVCPVADSQLVERSACEPDSKGTSVTLRRIINNSCLMDSRGKKNFGDNLVERAMPGTPKIK